MTQFNLGPGSAPRKIAAMLCLAVAGIAIPLVLFRIFLGYTTLGTGIALIVAATVVAAGMIYLLQPKGDDE